MLPFYQEAELVRRLVDAHRVLAEPFDVLSFGRLCRSRDELRGLVDNAEIAARALRHPLEGDVFQPVFRSGRWTVYRPHADDPPEFCDWLTWASGNLRSFRTYGAACNAAVETWGRK